MNYFYKFLGGKSVAFALSFTVCGIILAFAGKLTGQYVALVTAVQGLVAGRSVADDFHARAAAKIAGLKTEIIPQG